MPSKPDAAASPDPDAGDLGDTGPARVTVRVRRGSVHLPDPESPVAAIQHRPGAGGTTVTFEHRRPRAHLPGAIVALEAAEAERLIALGVVEDAAHPSPPVLSLGPALHQDGPGVRSEIR